MNKEQKKRQDRPMSSQNAWLVIALLALVGAAAFFLRPGSSSSNQEKADVTSEVKTPLPPSSDSDSTKTQKNDAAGETKGAEQTPPRAQSIVRNRLEPDATKRLNEKPQTIKTVLNTSGRGENANWGGKGVYSFVLTHVIVCDAQILEKKETPLGEIRVVEQRTYTEARQMLQLSDFDVVVDIEHTLPVKEVSSLVDGLSSVCAALGGETIGAGISATWNGAKMLIDKIDGKSARQLLGGWGGTVTEKVRSEFDNFVAKKFRDLFRTDELEGKSYRITYYQDKDTGNPLRVDIAHANDKEPLSEDEWLALRRANVFMDSKIAPDKGCSPGDTWKIDASDFECLMDPYVDGSYKGIIEIERKDNDKEGNWVLGVNPGTVSIVSDQGRGTGELRLTEGSAVLDWRNSCVKFMQIAGNGNMKNLNRHHFLFQSRFEGNCKFQATMTTVLKNDAKK